MSNNYKLLTLIFGILLVTGVLVVFFKPECLFLKLFSIPCPGCGLTRAFISIFHGNIIAAVKYNFLSIPIFIFLLLSLILFIIDLIKKTNYLERYLLFFKKHYKLIIVIILIEWGINIIKY